MKNLQKKIGPFTVTSSETKYKNPWIEVVEDRVVRTDGKEGLFGVVHYGKFGNVGVLPVDKEGNTYLIKEFRYALERENVEIVCGGIEAGESFEDAGKRELKEELGITAKKWTYFGVTHPITSIMYVPMHLFLAEDLEFGESRQESTEIISSVKVSLEKAFRMVNENEITQTVGSLLILKTWLHFQKNKFSKV